MRRPAVSVKAYEARLPDSPTLIRSWACRSRARCWSGVPFAGEAFGAVNRPEAKPWTRGSSSKGPPPRTASRERSEKVAMPVPAMFFCVAWTKRASSATSPKFQPSP